MRYVCNFCGSAHKKGDFFILGLDGVICEECVNNCKGLLLRKRLEREPKGFLKGELLDQIKAMQELVRELEEE